MNGRSARVRRPRALRVAAEKGPHFQMTTSPTTSDQRNGDTPDVSPRKPATRRGPGGRFVKTTATNPDPAGPGVVPGAAGIPPLTEPIAIGDVVWTADDCHPTASPIGAALALEIAGDAA